MTNGLGLAEFRLIACRRDGTLFEPLRCVPQQIADACQAMAGLYEKDGYVPPWTGYVTAHEDTTIGGGAFVAPPCEGRVEIAYFTLPEWEGRGIATLTARSLIEIARAASPKIKLTAKTQPQRNASVAILEKLGFAFAGIEEDEEIGEAWAWLLS